MNMLLSTCVSDRRPLVANKRSQKKKRIKTFVVLYAKSVGFRRPNAAIGLQVKNAGHIIAYTCT